MRITTLFSLSLVVAVTSAFSTTSPLVTRTSSSKLFSSVESDELDMPLIINGKNIDLTPAIVDYVNKRIGGPLKKLSSNGAIRECDVILSVSKNPKISDGHRVEITTNLKGTTFHASKESPDMYTSIDACAKALNRKLRKYKERKVEGYHGGASMADDFMDLLEDLEVEEDDTAEAADDGFEEFFDPEAPVITKVNSFATDKPISMKEAIFALDYIDHDFYVFRNEETDNINVIYKRNSGGIGHVEP